MSNFLPTLGGQVTDADRKLLEEIQRRQGFGQQVSDADRAFVMPGGSQLPGFGSQPSNADAQLLQRGGGALSDQDRALLIQQLMQLQR